MLNIGAKLQELRLARGLSLRELAAKADVSASLLSQIENSKANPSVMSLLGIAVALDVPVHTFFPDESTDIPVVAEPSAPREEAAIPVPQTASALRSLSDDGMGGALRHHLPHSGTPIVQVNTRPRIDLMGGVTWARLTPGRENGIEFLEITYAPGGSSGPAMSRHGGREFGLILEGELVLELGFDRYILGPGDSVAFDSSVPHRLSNPSAKPMRAVWVNVTNHSYAPG